MNLHHREMGSSTFPYPLTSYSFQTQSSSVWRKINGSKVNESPEKTSSL